MADMYFSVQSYGVANPRPYDDTGWTYQYLRDIVLNVVTDKSLLDQPMAPITADVTAAGGVEGTGTTIVVNNNSDNNLVAFRFKFAKTKMSAAEEDFTVDGKQFSAGSFIIANANRAQVEPVLKELGLSASAVSAVPADLKQHDLDVPRIGYVHSWSRTQDEGWVRAAFDTYGIPYTYFADQKLRDGNLRAKYDVIIMPHIGGSATSQVNGIAKTGKTPLPYMKSAETPNLGVLDQSPDIRGGMGIEGLYELYKFVQAGGTLITEGSTATIFPEYNYTNGITVDNSAALFARGSIMRGVIADKKSPIVYGYEGTQLPVYFNQDPVLNVAGGQTPAQQIAAAFAGGGGGGGGPAGVGQNTTPMASRPVISPWDGPNAPAQGGTAGAPGPGGGRRGGGGAPGGGGPDTTGLGAVAQQFGLAGPDPATRPRVVMQFPADTTQMLLSGTLAGGRVLSNKAQIVDAPLGDGHVVMFAIRPFWRWQTQGTYMLGFNTILNWNDLGAGRATGTTPPTRANGTGQP